MMRSGKNAGRHSMKQINKAQIPIGMDGKPQIPVNMGRQASSRRMVMRDEVTTMRDGGSLRMVEKAGDMVPFYAADGIGKMKSGGDLMDATGKRGYGAARKPS